MILFFQIMMAETFCQYALARVDQNFNQLEMGKCKPIETFCQYPLSINVSKHSVNTQSIGKINNNIK